MLLRASILEFLADVTDSASIDTCVECLRPLALVPDVARVPGGERVLAVEYLAPFIVQVLADFKDPQDICTAYFHVKRIVRDQRDESRDERVDL